MIYNPMKYEEIQQVAVKVCVNCPYVVYPYESTHDGYRHRVDKKYWTVTCRMNKSYGGQGYFSLANPFLCKRGTIKYEY